MRAIFLDAGSESGMTRERKLRPGLDPVRGFRVQGIIGPVMLRVAPLEFFFYGRIAVAPEAGQIPGDLGRTAGGREQVQLQRQTTVGDGGRIRGRTSPESAPPGPVFPRCNRWAGVRRRAPPYGSGPVCRAAVAVARTAGCAARSPGPDASAP